MSDVLICPSKFKSPGTAAATAGCTTAALASLATRANAPQLHVHYSSAKPAAPS